MKSLYTHAPEHPFHISVGAILVNEKGEVLAHKISQEKMPSEQVYKLDGLKEVYILMRESLENGETLEEAVHRGLQEEFGVEGEVRKYLGSIQAMIPEDETYEKTTLYFEVFLKVQGERMKDDPESHSDLVWVDPKVLIERMKEQGGKVSRGDLDESRVIEAYLKYA